MFSQKKTAAPETEAVVAPSQRMRWWKKRNPPPQPPYAPQRSSAEKMLESLVRQQTRWADATEATEAAKRASEEVIEREKANAKREAKEDRRLRRLRREAEEREWQSIQAEVAAQQKAIEDAEREKAAKQYRSASQISPEVLLPPRPNYYRVPPQKTYWEHAAVPMAVPMVARLSVAAPVVVASSSAERARMEAADRAKTFLAAEDERSRAENDARQLQIQKTWTRVLNLWRRVLVDKTEERLPVQLKHHDGNKEDLVSYLDMVANVIIDAFPLDVSLLEHVIAMAYKSRIDTAEQHAAFDKIILENSFSKIDVISVKTFLDHPDILKTALDTKAGMLAAYCIASSAKDCVETAPEHVQEFVFVWFYGHVLPKRVAGSDADFESAFDHFMSKNVTS